MPASEPQAREQPTDSRPGDEQGDNGQLDQDATPHRYPDAESQTGFAPTDLTDGREPLNWKTRYPEKSAQRGIWFEAGYLAFLLAAIPAFLAYLYAGDLPFAPIGRTS